MISSNKRNFCKTKNTHLRYCHRQYVKRWKGPFNLRHKMKCLNMVVNIQCKYLNNCFSKSLTFCVIKSENNTTTTTTKITSIVIGILCGTKNVTQHWMKSIATTTTTTKQIFPIDISIGRNIGVVVFRIRMQASN